MEVFKYRPWNDFTADVIANSRIFFPSRKNLNDLAELIHPVRFEASTWHQSFQEAHDAIEPATRIAILGITAQFDRLDAIADEDERVFDNPEYKRYGSARDRFLGILEALYDRVEVHQALRHYVLAQAEDRALLYATEAQVLERLNNKLNRLGIVDQCYAFNEQALLGVIMGVEDDGG